MSAADLENTRSAAGDRNPWLIAVVVSIATFMLVLDTSIANVALRNIAGSLAAGVDESTWVITTYLVANAVVLPISGWLSDVVGRKRFYMLCVATFTASSLLCALAPNLSTLIFFRILQGLGGGGMAPSEQAILADTFPAEKRAQGFAVYGIAVIVAPTIGPALGGWLTDNWSWHWIFLINVPIGVLSLVLVQWLLVEPDILKRERRQRLENGLRIDWVGFLLIAMALGALEIVLDKGQRDDWFQSDFIVAFSVISTLSFAAFFPWEWTRKDPIVDVHLLFTRQLGTSFLVMMAVGAILFGSTQLIPQLLQESYGYTAMLSGLSLMPGGFAMLCMMPLAGMSGRISPKLLMGGGLLVVAFSMWHMTTLTPDASFGFFAWARVYQTIGLPFLFVPINTVSYADLPGEKTSQASSLINVARNLGGSIGVSLANTELVQRAQFHQERLVEHIVPSSVNYQQALQHVLSHFGHQIGGGNGTGAATAWLGQLIDMQSSMLAYIDVFYDLAIFILLTLPLVLLLRSRTPKGPTPMH